MSSCTRRFSSRTAFVATVVLLIVAVGLVRPHTVSAICTNGDRGIWVKSGQADHAHGVQLDKKILENNAGDCTGGAFDAAATAYMGVGGDPTFTQAEIGYVEFGSPPQFSLFTEWEVAGNVTSCGGNSCLYSSGCIVLNHIITLRVELHSAASNTWDMKYACSGGGFTTRDTSPNLGSDFGEVNGEISNHSTTNYTLFSENTNLIFKNQMNQWSQTWGSMSCAGLLTNDAVVNDGWNARAHGTTTKFDTDRYPTGLC